MTIPGANVYLIETPLQLLNAIEAKNYFELKNNHLIIHYGIAPRGNVEQLIVDSDWDKVHDFTFVYYNVDFKSRILGNAISNRIVGYHYDYQLYLSRKKFDDFALSIGKVDNLFLGNYMKSLYECKHMYHLANILNFDYLYILDDGTDVLQINDDRKNACLDDAYPKKPDSFLSRLKAAFRETFIEWNVKDADKVTFFSAYDMDVKNGDRLVKNTYKHLRELSINAAPSNDVFFLGQWLVESDYMEEGFYLEYLRKVRNYFIDDKVVYIPHPRESIKMVTKISDTLGFKIRKFEFPIEYEISVRGNRPKVIASFFCSALHNCRLILGQDVKIKVFYIEPEHLIRAPRFVQNVYDHFERYANESFEIVKLWDTI